MFIFVPSYLYFSYNYRGRHTLLDKGSAVVMNSGIAVVWIPDFENLYSVTELGKIWSTKSGIYLVQGAMYDGYPIISFRKNGKKISFKKHRLLAILFKPNPENLVLVEHLDDNPLNCTLENLDWSTSARNRRHAFLNKRAKIYTKLTKYQVSEILSKHNSGSLTIDLAAEYKVNRRTISNICNENTRDDMMRIYSNLQEAIEETQREVKEFGFHVQRESYQSIKQENATLEIHGYGFLVDLSNDPEKIENTYYDKDYCNMQLRERINPQDEFDLNPGRSSYLREEIWRTFFDENEQLSYTYAERISREWYYVIELLRDHPTTRQCVLPVFNLGDLKERAERVRVPCSLLYHFEVDSKERLEMTYVMRSTDVMTHFPNDITMAAKMLEWAATELNRPFGTLYFFTSNMHEYETELRGVF